VNEFWDSQRCTNSRRPSSVGIVPVNAFPRKSSDAITLVVARLPISDGMDDTKKLFRRFNSVRDVMRPIVLGMVPEN